MNSINIQSIDGGKLSSDEIAAVMAMTTATVFKEPTSKEGVSDWTHGEQDVSPDNIKWLSSTFRIPPHTEKAKLHRTAEPTQVFRFVRHYTRTKSVTILSTCSLSVTGRR